MRTLRIQHRAILGLPVNNARFWHKAALKMVARRHGVSGVGGSNPLVPTRNSFKNQPLRLVFLCLFSVRGSNGELSGKNPRRRASTTLHNFGTHITGQSSNSAVLALLIM